ncbi:MAG TPA: stage V sporulation T C-terminal domain-containing protein, partial [Armatimonadota bacterium]|nr:stage V sporulation T C-terminal domain-containing protein [Armatimonadota bacterium]
LNRIAGLPMVICDRDHVVAAAGVSRKEYLERRVTPELDECVQTRRTFVESASEKLIPVEGINRAAEIVCPILASSDVTGAVVVLHPEEGDTAAPELSAKMAQVAAAFLGKQMEE